MTETYEPGPFGARRLTDEEWKVQTMPLYYFKINSKKEPYNEWTALEYEIACKYALSRCTTWFYYDNKTFVFGSQEDFVLFKLWVTGNKMVQNHEFAVE